MSRSSAHASELPTCRDVLMFAGGDRISDAVLHHLAHADLIIAADSGLEHAQSLGFTVDLVVGDLDSVDAAALADAEAHGAAVERHPVAKDATDLELALRAALERSAARVTVVGGHGGRVDHFFANALLLASEDFAAISIDAWIGHAHVTVVRGLKELHGQPGSLCSLLPAGDLAAGSTRGVSNVLVGTTAAVSVRDGVLLAVQPNALEVQQ
jgi:thiamine pyrophosphokinase